MADRSGIEWTDATWNPIRGCTRVSEGCRNCYAERFAARFRGAGQPYAGLVILRREPGDDFLPEKGTPQWTGQVQFVPEMLEQPLHWKSARKIFVNSMSDLFHPAVHDEWITEIFSVMAYCERHTFQILTKRADRMQAWMARLDIVPPSNVWMGVSVEDQATANDRIPHLLNTPAAVRWVSYEPALGLVDFYKIADFSRKRWGLDWLVAGGESGPGARPAHPDWFRTARDQCRAAGVPFFFKQWGEWLNISQLRPAFSDAELDRVTFKTVRREGERKADLSDLYFRVGKKRAGNVLDGERWAQFPVGRA